MENMNIVFFRVVKALNIYVKIYFLYDSVWYSMVLSKSRLYHSRNRKKTYEIVYTSFPERMFVIRKMRDPKQLEAGEVMMWKRTWRV